MKWNLKPVSVMKQFAVSLSMATMCLSPLAQGAAAVKQKNLINQYLKETGLTTKKMTVLEFWRMVRHVYPENMRNDLDTWVAANRNQMMPDFSATSFIDKNGVEQVRVNLSRDGENVSLTFTGDEEVPVKFNAVPITKKELLNYNNFNGLLRKLAKEDKTFSSSLKNSKSSSFSSNLVLSAGEFQKLTLRQKAEYLYQSRLALEAAQKVFKAKYGAYAFVDMQSENKYDYALRVLLGEWAQAKGAQIPSVGEPCIVAGYLSKYGKNRSCGSDDIQSLMKASKTSCSGGGVACNPMVYGYGSRGESLCVSRDEVRYATRICGEDRSPLDPNNSKDKQRIVESYMKHFLGKEVNLKLNKEGKLSAEDYDKVKDYLSELQTYIGSAVAECNNNPLSKIQEVRDDQKSACEEIRKRAFILEKFTVEPTPVAPAPGPDHCVKPPSCEEPKKCEKPPVCLPPAEVDCEKEIAGSKLKDGICQCESPQIPKQEGDKKVCAVFPASSAEPDPAARPEPGAGRPEPSKDDDKGPGWWDRNKSWFGPVAGGLALMGLFWWMTKSANSSFKKPIYVPPAPVPNPTTNPTVTPTPVLPPPVAPCSGTWVNGVCVPPVVVAPPASTSEGGTKTIGTPSAGGTR